MRIDKTILISIALTLLLIAGVIPSVMAHNPSTYKGLLIIETTSDPESVDPAWAYDTASSAIIQNVYEGLITFRVILTDGSYENWPYDSGKTDQFEPCLAASMPTIMVISETSPEGVKWVQRWTFTIKTGIKFHDLNVMTPADVEYSFERILVQDRDGGPQWMLYFPLLGTYGANTSDPLWGAKIDHAIESDTTHVWFNLANATSELTLLQILSGTCSSVVEKNWATAHGDWDGTFGTTWVNWHNPSISPLDNPPIMMGTGPYMFTDWTKEVSWQIDRYPGYWDGWPARIQSGSSERLPGYISTILHTYNTVWTSRRADFLAGASDVTDVPRQMRDQFRDPRFGDLLPDIVCYYPLETLQLDAAFFTFNITATSPWVGTVDPVHRYGSDPAFPWGSDRIPLDLFSDINVRKGFAYAFDYGAWLTATYLGEGRQPSDPLVDGIRYDNSEQKKYNYNLTETEYYLKLAWNGSGANPSHNPALVTPGELWTHGMGFTITYNVGNIGRQTAAEIWAMNIKNLRPGIFNLATAGIAWGSKYLPDMVASKLPIFATGWLADYADADNFVFPYMHSKGTFAAWQKYSNPRVDDLIKAGATMANDPPGTYEAAGSPWDVADPLALRNADGTPVFNTNTIPPNSTWPRRSIYYELQTIYYKDAPSTCLVHPSGRHWTRGWVRGWYYNALLGGSLTPFIDSTAPTTSTLYAYHLFKQGTHLGDANMDGSVDVADLGWISGRWGEAGLSPPGTKANIEGDINGGNGGLTGGPTQGIPDGSVDVVDLGLIAAYWDTGPTGPHHP